MQEFTIDIRTLFVILGIVLTFAIFIFSVIFKTGHLAARIEELEKWRVSIRADMHEISDELRKFGEEMKRLSTLIEERTDRRNFSRDEQ